MTGNKRFKEYAISLFVFGLLAFNYPVLSAVNRLSMLWGIPVLFLYVFVVWFLVIVAMAFSVKQTSTDETGTGDETSSK